MDDIMSYISIILLAIALFLYEGDRAKLIPVCFLFLVAILNISVRKKEDDKGK